MVGKCEGFCKFEITVSFPFLLLAFHYTFFILSLTLFCILGDCSIALVSYVQ